MKQLIITAFFIITSLSGKAQFNINYYVGYGSYKMNDMKDMMNYAVQMGIDAGQLPLHAKLIDNFPAYIIHSMDAAYRFDKNEAGIKFSYMTTGSKIAAADYSGSYNEKMITNGYRIGALYRFHFYSTGTKQHDISFFTEFSPALTRAEMKTSGKVIIYNSNNTTTTEDAEKTSLTKNGFSIQPLGGICFKLYNHLLLTVSSGYDFEFGANLSEGFRMDFSGLRINAGVGFVF